LLDIDASKEGRKIDLDTIHDVASECFMPLTVGGGLNSVDDIGAALFAGADKVALNTAALKRPELIKEGADVFGCQCIVVSIDVKESANGELLVYSHSGVPFDRPLVDWAREAEALGAGEILLNSVDRDGVMCGYDLALISRVSEKVRIPVIACGGAAVAADGAEAIRAGASAIAAASIFHFTSITPEEVKAEVAKPGFPTRQLVR
jgi:cyclase